MNSLVGAIHSEALNDPLFKFNKKISKNTYTFYNNIYKEADMIKIVLPLKFLDFDIIQNFQHTAIKMLKDEIKKVANDKMSNYS